MLSKLFHRGEPRAEENEPTDSHGLLKAWKRIVVPTLAAPFSMRSIQAGCKLVDPDIGTEMRLIFLIEVPRSAPLHATLPFEERMAEDVLEPAAVFAQRHGVRAQTEVVRGRDAVEALLRYVAQHNVDLLVLGARPDGTRGLPITLCREIYQRATCEVLLDFMPTGS